MAFNASARKIHTTWTRSGGGDVSRLSKDIIVQIEPSRDDDGVLVPMLSYYGLVNDIRIMMKPSYLDELNLDNAGPEDSSILNLDGGDNPYTISMKTLDLKRYLDMVVPGLSHNHKMAPADILKQATGISHQ